MQPIVFKKAAVAGAQNSKSVLREIEFALYATIVTVVHGLSLEL